MKLQLTKSYLLLMLILVLLVPVKTLLAQSQTHPSIWVSNSEKAKILDNISKYTWASTLNDQLHTRNDSIVAIHKTSPQNYINGIAGFPGNRYSHLNALTRASECALLYYLTDNTDYAQFAADVFQYYTKNISAASSLNIHNDYFIESRALYPKIGIVYDFIYHFLKNPNTTIYNRATGTRVAFDNAAAQLTVKRIASNVFSKGSLNSNHSILEGNAALFNILCIDNDSERATYFNKFLNGDTKHDAFVGYSLNKFSVEGIWPESVTYSKFPQEIVLQMLDVIDRYQPSLNIITNNMRILEGAFLFENLKYPNKTIALFGDSRRADTGTDNMYRRLLRISTRKNLPEYTERAGKLLKKSYADNGGYNPTITTQTLDWNNPIHLLWGVDIEDNVVPATETLNSSLKITHAGIMLQRNYNGTNAKDDGLAGFIGGAHYVHSHLSGIGMELYGKGYVMGSGGGDADPDDRDSDIYTNYYRIYAGHNTVVVNGTSVGRGAGSWKSDGLLFQNTAVNVAAEPAATVAPISNNFSFATQFLDDDVNNVDQQRTLSMVRTGAKTAYYLDIFRSKSNGTNNFHDYIYHNLGDDYSVANLDGSSMALTSTPGRFPINPVTYNSSTINFPGWHYFENPQTSASSTAGAKVTFNLTAVTPAAYMHMLLPGGESREYTKTLAPPTLETDASYSTKKSNVIVVRQNGEAWNKPFVSVFEPSGETTSSVTNVENIIDNNIIIGAKVTSLVDGEAITDYIISQPIAAGTYTNATLNFSFSGRFGILRIGEKDNYKRVSLYIGEGTEMSYDGRLLTADATKKGFLEYGGTQSPPIQEKIEIEAEDYNTGGQGVGYNDQDGDNTSNNTTYRTDAADLINTSNASNGISVSSFAGNLNNNNGDWMKYTFNVTNAGRYKLSIIAARGGSGLALNAGQFNIDDNYFVKTINIASTGDGNSFAQNDLADLVYLSAGSHTMRYGSRVSKSHNPDKFIIELQEPAAKDVTPPVTSTKNITIQLDPQGSAAITPQQVDNGSSDDSGSLTLRLNKTTFDCTNVGENTVTLTVTDANDNVSSATATVTVEDKIAPTVLVQNKIIQLNAEGTAIITTEDINNGSTDNCSIASIVLNKTAFDCSNIGANTVTLTVTDVNGNVSSGTATVTVEDKIAPKVVTKNISVSLLNGNVSITAAQINDRSYDNCGIASMSVSPATFTCGQYGNHTVTLTVIDNNGNESSQTAIVNILGVTPQPSIAVSRTDNTFTALDSKTIALGYGAQSLVLTASNAKSAANATTYSWSPAVGLSSTITENPTFTPTSAGTYTFTVEATNEFGCTATEDVTITVLDVRCGDKILVCQKTNSATNPSVQICISSNAVNAHLVKGSVLGSCASSGNTIMEVRENAPQLDKVFTEPVKLSVYPNPFSKVATVKFSVPVTEERVSLVVFNNIGVKVATLYNGKAVANEINTFTLNGFNYIPGTYFVRLTTSSGAQSFKIIITN